MKKLIDFVFGIPLTFLVMWIRLKYILWVWATFCAGLFGITALPLRPVFGVSCLISLTLASLAREKRDKDKGEFEREYPVIFNGIFWMLLLGVAWALAYLFGKVAL